MNSVSLRPELLTDLSAGRFAEAESRLPTAKDCAERRKKNDVLAQKIKMVEAILAHNAKDFDVAIEASIQLSIKSYSRAAVREYPDGLLSYDKLGMAAIAKRNGLETAVQSVYFPLELLAD